MSFLQKQCLLAALGYYPGNAIDGCWGEQSRDATRRFQEENSLEPDGIFGPQTEAAIRRCIAEGCLPAEKPGGEPSFWDNIRYWTREEFRCQCGGKFCDGFPAEPDRTLVELADDVRSHFGRPGHRSSGLRCTIHNVNEGGVHNSRHLTGKALDFRIEGVGGDTLLAHVLSDSRTRYAYQIGGGPYVHMDVE